jgi:hypothetical protein
MTRREDQMKLVALEIYPLSDAPKFFAEEFRVMMPVAHVESGDMDRICSVLLDHPGNVPVNICLIYPSNEKVFIAAASRFKVIPDAALVAEVEQILGEGSAYTRVRRETCLRPQQKRKWQGGSAGP